MDFLPSKSSSPSLTIAEAIDEMISPNRLQKAKAYFDDIAQKVPSIIRFKTTPITSSSRPDQIMVADYVIWLLAVIDSIVSGLSFQNCSDLSSDPIIRFALNDAEQAIKDTPNVFRAYAFMHDLAKPNRLLLIAKPGTAGEKEGFVRSNHRASEYTTSSELVRFDKLRRAGLADDIEATFGDADKAIIGPQYASDRAAIVQACGLSVAYTKFVTELCWSHKDLEEFFVTPNNSSAFSIFSARAGKAGINVDSFLDSLLAISLLESVSDFGLSPSHGGVGGGFVRLISAEHSSSPDRHAARLARHRHQRKLRVKQILAEHGLSPEIIFPLLGTPLGPVRGTVMHAIYACIRGESSADSFGIHATTIEERALKAKAALDAKNLVI